MSVASTVGVVSPPDLYEIQVLAVTVARRYAPGWQLVARAARHEAVVDPVDYDAPDDQSAVHDWGDR